MGQMADPPSKPRKLVIPSTRGAAVQPVAGLGGDKVIGAGASGRHGEKGGKEPPGAAPRSLRASGRTAGLSVPDPRPPRTELPNLRLNLPVPLGAEPSTAPPPLPGLAGKRSRTARQLRRELGREATLEEIAEAMGPDWTAVWHEDAQKIPREPVAPGIPDGDEKDGA